MSLEVGALGVHLAAARVRAPMGAHEGSGGFLKPGGHLLLLYIPRRPRPRGDGQGGDLDVFLVPGGRRGLDLREEGQVLALQAEEQLNTTCGSVC